MLGQIHAVCVPQSHILDCLLASKQEMNNHYSTDTKLPHFSTQIIVTHSYQIPNQFVGQIVIVHLQLRTNSKDEPKEKSKFSIRARIKSSSSDFEKDKLGIELISRQRYSLQIRGSSRSRSSRSEKGIKEFFVIRGF